MSSRYLSEGQQGLIRLKLGLVSRRESALCFARKVLKEVFEDAECFRDTEQLQWDLNVLSVGKVTLQEVSKDLANVGCSAEWFYELETAQLQESVERGLQRLNLMISKGARESSLEDVPLGCSDVIDSERNIRLAKMATDYQVEEGIITHLSDGTRYANAEYAYRDMASLLNSLSLLINFFASFKLLVKIEFKPAYRVANCTELRPPLEHRPQLQPNAPSFPA